MSERLHRHVIELGGRCHGRFAPLRMWRSKYLCHYNEKHHHFEFNLKTSLQMITSYRLEGVCRIEKYHRSNGLIFILKVLCV